MGTLNFFYRGAGEMSLGYLQVKTFFFVLLTLVSIPMCFAENPKEVINSIGMKFVLIPKGTFLMGSPPNEDGSKDDERQHKVTISQDYYLGIHEVTQAQFELVMGSNPSFFQGDKVAERHPRTGRVLKEPDSSNHPVESLTYEEALRFCKRLSARIDERDAGRSYRLPTEAEWEYACRAGSNTAYCFGDFPNELSDYSWFEDNSEKKSHPVGLKKPNAWGLYDMHGNVWEWCQDWYGEYPVDAVTDPKGVKKGSRRIDRGGSWGIVGSAGRCAFRSSYIPTSRTHDLGFRVVLTVEK